MSRVLPSAPEAEASLLGTMLVYPSSSRTALEEGLEAAYKSQEIKTY